MPTIGHLHTFDVGAVSIVDGLIIQEVRYNLGRPQGRREAMGRPKI
jgi:hypothetical protein